MSYVYVTCELCKLMFNVCVSTNSFLKSLSIMCLRLLQFWGPYAAFRFLEICIYYLQTEIDLHRVVFYLDILYTLQCNFNLWKSRCVTFGGINRNWMSVSVTHSPKTGNIVENMKLKYSFVSGEQYQLFFQPKFAPLFSLDHVCGSFMPICTFWEFCAPFSSVPFPQLPLFLLILFSFGAPWLC